MEFEYGEFIEYFERKVEDFNEKEGGGLYIRFLRQGESGENEREKQYIHDLNLKYHGDSGETLREDYLLLGREDKMCRFRMYDIFLLYKKEGWDAVGKVIAHNYRLLLKLEKSNSTDKVKDFEYIKKNLFIKIGKAGKKSPEGEVCRKVGDLLLSLFFVIFEDEHSGKKSLGASAVTDRMPAMWEVTEEELWDQAFKNMMERYPAIIVPDLMNPKAVDLLSVDISKIWKDEGFDNYNVPLVTATNIREGIIAMFYPGVCEKLAELFKGSFYILFAGEDGAYIHARNTIPPSVLAETVKSVQGNLSDKIYLYDSKLGEILAL